MGLDGTPLLVAVGQLSGEVGTLIESSLLPPMVENIAHDTRPAGAPIPVVSYLTEPGLVRTLAGVYRRHHRRNS